MTSTGGERIDPAVVAGHYQQHGESLRRFLVGLLRDSQLADDALQTTFAKLAEHGHTAQPAAIRGWLFRVAYNEAMLLRRRERVDQAARNRAAWARPSVGDPADSGLARTEIVLAIRRAIEQLPVEQQVVVRMRIYEEKTFAVIAQELGIPLGTALGRMRAALQKLRGQLGAQWGDES